MDDEGIRRSEGRYRALFEALDVPITLNELVRDERGNPCDIRQLVANPAYDRMIGHPAGTEHGRTATEVKGSPDLVLVAAAGEVMASGRPVRFHSDLPDGRAFDVTLFRVDADVLGITGTEVTARRRAELERERLLVEREELVRTISHDLRAPLTSISSQAQLLARSPESERVAAKANAIAQNARRMADMIRDLVDSSRADAGVAIAPEVLALGPFLADVVARHDGGLESERVRLAVPDGLPPLRADAAKLERVIVNLLANALRYAPPDTQVDLVAGVDGTAVAIEVTDRGPGIPAEDVSRVFDRFFRSQRASGDGLGLGLHIARRFVEAHGGTIEVRSEEGRGATFRVRLPVDS